jgi:hypothetical protein
MKIVRLFRKKEKTEEVAQKWAFADPLSLSLKEVMSKEPEQNTYKPGRQKCLPSNPSDC